MINYHDTYHDPALTFLGLAPRLWRFCSFSVKQRGGSLLLFAGQLVVRQPLSDDLTHGKIESVAVCDRGFPSAAIVEPELLLVQVTEQMERLYAYIRPVDASLEQAPVIFKTVCVDPRTYSSAWSTTWCAYSDSRPS